MPKEKQEKLPRELMMTAWVLVICALPTILDSTMVNIAINKLQTDLSSSLNMVQWAITGYVLAMAVAVSFSGWLMDHLNGKKVLTVAVVIFGAFSLFSGLAWNIESFIAFRVLQGLSGGVITMLSMSLLMQIAPKKLLGQLIAIVSTPMILGPILGPVIGGFLVQYGNWRWIFFVNVPIVIISTVLNITLLRNFIPANKESKMDWWGTINLAAAITAILYGIMQGSENITHFFNTKMLIFTGLGLLLLIVYVIYDFLRQHQTVMPLRYFSHRNFTAGNIGVLLTGVAVNGVMLLLPLYFQNIRHFTVAEAGLILVPQGIGMLIARPYVGRLIDRIGSQLVVLISLAISLLGTLPLIFVHTDTNLILLGLVLFVRGLGVGGITMPMMTDVFYGFKPTEISGVSVANRMIQYTGQSLGSAIMSAIVTNSLMTYMKTHAGTSTFANLQLIGQLKGYQMGFLVSTILLIVIAIPALFLTSRKDKEKV
ncbi:MDR family MFS transporter [Lactococcus nasutitermitis]|uniref:MDR family MFS transporter n=1 Tax=Lactococcus nasutitermitis TaxID=1652957 RepID=A0ABV9JD62_9LACT|nr:MDR family MFS transporter [Lactococcus nasutitermitis]